MSRNKKTAKKEIKQIEKSSKLPMIVALALLLGAIGIGGYYFLYNAEGGEETFEIAEGNPETPTKAYEKLFEAVKNKDKEVIKAMMSKDSIKLGEMQAGQSKKDLNEVLKNGFFTANMTQSLPPIRDERVKGRYGAVEVYSRSKSRWENIPFIIEDGAWKLAAGNMFAGNFKSPGKSRSIIEKENANARGETDMVPYGNGNLNTNVKPKIIDPMKDNKIPPMMKQKQGVNPTVKKDSKDAQEKKADKPAEKKEK